METIRDLARGGRSVVCTIHQPRETIFELFDKLLLLTKGRTSFYGPRSEIGQFMSSAGHGCPQSSAMADFLLDVMTVDTRTKELTETTQAIVDKVQAHYESSALGTDAKVEAEAITLSDSTAADVVVEEEQWNLSWWTEMTLLLARASRKREPLPTENLLEDADGWRRPSNTSVASRRGSLRPSFYADVRHIDDVIAIEGLQERDPRAKNDQDGHLSANIDGVDCRRGLHKRGEGVRPKELARSGGRAVLCDAEPSLYCVADNRAPFPLGETSFQPRAERGRLPRIELLYCKNARRHAALAGIVAAPLHHPVLYGGVERDKWGTILYLHPFPSD